MIIIFRRSDSHHPKNLADELVLVQNKISKIDMSVVKVIEVLIESQVS